MAREKEKFVRNVFERIAPHYDRMNTLISFGQHKRWRRFTMQKMKVQPTHRVLDVCCGTGDWALALAQQAVEGQVIGLDFSPKMLAVAREKMRKAGLLERVQLVEGNAMTLPYADHSFDCATIGFALRNVPDLVQVLREMNRVVKPGGQVVSLELSKPHNRLFRSLYYLYFHHLLPLMGKWFAGSYEQYKWLPESLIRFPDYERLKEIMLQEVGFQRVEVYPLTGGITAVHIGYKKEKGVDDHVEEVTNHIGNDKI